MSQYGLSIEEILLRQGDLVAAARAEGLTDTTCTRMLRIAEQMRDAALDIESAARELEEICAEHVRSQKEWASA